MNRKKPDYTFHEEDSDRKNDAHIKDTSNTMNSKLFNAKHLLKILKSKKTKIRNKYSINPADADYNFLFNLR